MVQVRFVTQLEERWRVTDAPIQLPTRLTRGGLSEVVNHLLETSTPRPFDFLLNSELLRGSVGKALARHELSGEEVITLEYVECVPPPRPEPSCPHQDWVAALAAHPSGGRLLLSACYDHAAYVWDGAGKQVAALAGHTGPVKGVAWLSGGGGGGGILRAATASKDQTVRTWSVAPNAAGGAASVACEAVLVGHKASVEGLAANPSGDRLCSGGWDGAMLLWAVSEAPEAAETAPPTKRSKGAAGDGAGSAAAPAEASPITSLSGHGGCVSALCWPTSTLLYSGSWDGTVREWQVEVGTPSATLAGQAAVLCLDVSLGSSLIASGHTDHCLRIWDSRLQQAAMQLQLPHKGWVSAARWCVQTPHLLASACYDGTVRLWDVRSTVPLHQLGTHAGKALSLTWDGPERLASGGSDAEIRVSSIAMPAES